MKVECFTSFYGVIFTFLLLYGFSEIITASDCNLKTFMKCSNAIFKISSRNTCNALNRSIACFENVTTTCGMHENLSEPLCQNEVQPDSCDLLSEQSTSPITSARYVTPLCKIYSRLKGCYDIKCGPTGNKFKGGLPGKGSPCPRNVPRECVSPDPKFNTISQDTCVQMSSSKNCYVSKMSHCGGTNLDVLAVDVTVLGFVHTVQQCKDQEYGFSKDGGVCNEIPLDAFVHRDLLDKLNTLYGENLTEIDEHVCNQLHYSRQMLEEYSSTCVNISEMNKHAVSDVLQDMEGPKTQCIASGYTAGSGIKIQSPNIIILFVAIFIININQVFIHSIQ